MSATVTSTDAVKWVFHPDVTLAPNTTYTVTVAGGPGGVTDLEGTPMAATVTWSFTNGP